MLPPSTAREARDGRCFEFSSIGERLLGMLHRASASSYAGLDAMLTPPPCCMRHRVIGDDLCQAARGHVAGSGGVLGARSVVQNRAVRSISEPHCWHRSFATARTILLICYPGLRVFKRAVEVSQSGELCDTRSTARTQGSANASCTASFTRNPDLREGTPARQNPGPRSDR